VKEGSRAALRLCVSFVILVCFSCTAPEGRLHTRKEAEEQRTGSVSETEKEKPKERSPKRADIEEVLSSLIQRLGDDEFRTRDDAHRKIKRILRESLHEPKEIQRLLSLLKEYSEKTKDEEVRMRLDSIVRSYSSFSKYLTSKYANGHKISESGDRKELSSVESLVKALEDNDWNVCLFAARTLSEIDNRLAIRKIIEVLKKGDGHSW